MVNRFREALEDSRGIGTFQAELAALPTELVALFEYLLLSIPKTQLKKAYQIFTMVLQYEPYKTKLSLLSCLYMDAYVADAQSAMRDSSIPSSMCNPIHSEENCDSDMYLTCLQNTLSRVHSRCYQVRNK